MTFFSESTITLRHDTSSRTRFLEPSEVETSDLISESKNRSIKKEKIQRAVHFHPDDTTEVYPHFHFRDLTMDEKGELWVTKAELEQTKHEALFTVSLIRHSLFLGDNLELTGRGLEPRNLRSITLSRQCVVRANKQHSAYVAEKYRVQSSKSRHLARSRAKADAEELTKMYSKMQVEREEREGIGYYGSLHAWDR